MTAKRRPSVANQELADWLTRQGYPTTPRAIRTWRANKWLAPAIVEPHGYARPTETSNSPEVFAQALAVAQIRNGNRTSPDRVVLGLFARGFPVPLDQLRLAFHRRFVEPMNALLEELSVEDSSTEGIVDSIAAGTTDVAPRTKTGRFMIRHAKHRDSPPMSIVESVNALLATVMVGGNVTAFDLGGSDALDELIDITSMRGLAEDQVEGVGAIVPGGRRELRADLMNIFKSISLDGLDNVIQSASYQELATSRDMLKKVFDFSQAFARNVPELGGPSSAYGTEILSLQDADDEAIAFLSVMFLSQVRRLGQAQVNTSLIELAPSFEAQAAMRQLLDELPTELSRYLGPEAVRQGAVPTDSESAAIVAAIAGLEERFPGFTDRLPKAAEIMQRQ